MIHAGDIYSTTPHGSFLEPFLAHMIMSDDESTSHSGIKNQWDNPAGEGEIVLFEPDELDIYINKVTLEAYIFYGKSIDHDSIDYIEYDHKDYRVDVVFENGQKIDLGVKIQWLVRPYLGKAEEISFVQTKDGEALDGKLVPVRHKNRKN